MRVTVQPYSNTAVTYQIRNNVSGQQKIEGSGYFRQSLRVHFSFEGNEYDISDGSVSGSNASEIK